MMSFLLAVIYLAFISLGLPDSLLGSAWPSMYGELHASVSSVGVISMLIAGGTIVSSLMSSRLIHKLGTGMVMVVSVAMTAVALLGFSISNAFWQLCLWSIPYGLGAGSVDAALNNFVALHYRSRQMSWLHCFWGIGATLGPYVMGLCLTGGLRWNGGYRTIGIFQVVLVIGLALSLPLWKRVKRVTQDDDRPDENLSIAQTLRLQGAKAMMLSFFCYCSIETTTGLWAGSYLLLFKGATAEQAATWSSMFYLGITVGRFLCGIVIERLGDRRMIRLGQGLILLGAITLLLPFGTTASLVGLALIGLGCAPIYPTLLHETPLFFGASRSQAMMGMQMASAYVGTTFMPPVFGWLANTVGIGAFPLFLLLFLVLMTLMVEQLNRLPIETR